MNTPNEHRRKVTEFIAHETMQTFQREVPEDVADEINALVAALNHFQFMPRLQFTMGAVVVTIEQMPFEGDDGWDLLYCLEAMHYRIMTVTDRHPKHTAWVITKLLTMLVARLMNAEHITIKVGP